MHMVAGQVVADAGSKVSLHGHGWHSVEAIGFLIASLGGIAVAEFFQARHRHDSQDVVRRSFEGASSGLAGTGRHSAVAVLPARVDTAIPVAEPRRLRRSTLLPLVALAGVGGAAVHVVVMPNHFEESAMYGTFFAVSAAVQLAYATLLVARPSRSLLIAGILGNAAIVGLWLVTRTLGIPLGPAAGTTESFGGLDILASVFELATALGATILVTRRQGLPRPAPPSSWTPWVWTTGAFAVAAIAATAVVSPPS